MVRRSIPLLRSVPGALIALAGSATVLGALPKPPWIDLANLDGSNGYVVPGIDPFDRSGVSVAGAGDVNGDGVDDILIGAQYADPNGNSYAGEAYVVFGGPTVGASGSVSPTALDGTNGFTITGVNAYDYIGRAVSSAGDVNGDGIDDLMLGASNTSTYEHPHAGITYIVFGRDVGDDGPFPASVDLASLDGTNGFTIEGANPFDRSGTAVSSAGDINGDGIDDLLIGAPYASPYFYTAVGEVYVVFGKNTEIDGLFPATVDLGALDGSDGFGMFGIDPYDYAGRSVSAAGDVNGDGVDDIIIGASGADPGGRVNAGESYVVFGKDTSVAGLFPATLQLAALNGTDGFVINGIDTGDSSGRPVASAGDVNGDTFDDLLISAIGGDPNGIPNAGEVSIVYGGTAVGAAGALDLSSLDGTNGFVLNGVRSSDFAGTSACAAGDLNDDGFSDLIIGVPGADLHCRTNLGEVYIYQGCPSPSAVTMVNLGFLEAPAGWFTTGLDANDALGRSVCFAGDVNGDDIPDIVMGAPFADPNLILGAGATYVVLGPHPTFQTYPVECPGDATGEGCTNIADFNILATNFGQDVVPFTRGDLTGNGRVNVQDFNLLSNDFMCGE